MSVLRTPELCPVCKIPVDNQGFCPDCERKTAPMDVASLRLMPIDNVLRDDVFKRIHADQLNVAPAFRVTLATGVRTMTHLALLAKR